jgi:hypothetical protein
MLDGNHKTKDGAVRNEVSAHQKVVLSHSLSGLGYKGPYDSLEGGTLMVIDGGRMLFPEDL